MESPFAFGAAFGLVALLELGDKTMLLLISLGTKHPPVPVIAGAALGMAAVTAIAVAIGSAIAAVVPLLVVQVASGILFIVFGAWTLSKGEEGEERERAGDPTRGPFVTASGLAFLAELGDKTMITVIALSATLNAPISVFLGGAAALALLAVLSVGLGRLLRRYVTAHWLRYVSAGLFLVAGALTIVEALLP